VYARECREANALKGKCRAVLPPTPAPTAPPTPAPTASPTPSPPTIAPTPAPPTLAPTPAPPTPAPTAQECVQLSGIYCEGTGSECDCNYCDNFRDNEPNGCARTCRVFNGIFESPPWSKYQWSAEDWSGARPNPMPDDHVSSCDWMIGSGKNKKGDNCLSCDVYAQACRRENVGQGNCKFSADLSAAVVAFPGAHFAAVLAGMAVAVAPAA